MEVTTVKGHDQAVISLLNDDVDVAVTFQDARNIVKAISLTYLKILKSLSTQKTSRMTQSLRVQI